MDPRDANGRSPGQGKRPDQAVNMAADTVRIPDQAGGVP